jgi:hypothetical protein
MLAIFKIGSWELFASGWSRTIILLISASWVSKITGVSHRCSARSVFFNLFFKFVIYLTLHLDYHFWYVPSI